jgi:hypothetical protein
MLCCSAGGPAFRKEEKMMGKCQFKGIYNKRPTAMQSCVCIICRSPQNALYAVSLSVLVYLVT